MIKNSNGFLELPSKYLVDKLVYTDRNGVFNGLKLSQDVILTIRNNINNLNTILNGNLKIVSNESEDPRQKVLTTDLNNGLILNSDNYKLSTVSAAKFIKETLGYKKCYFIGNGEVGADIGNMGLEIIDISKEIDLGNLIEDMPILFARPSFAINARYNNDEEIEKNIMKDTSFINLIEIIKKNKQKVVFCHTKPNCNRVKNNEEYRELNLGFYFELLVNKYGFVNGKDIFDLGKGDYGTGAFFDISLGLNNKQDYSKVIGIGDMPTDIEYTLQNGGTGILVNSGDGIITEEVSSRLRQYSGKFYNILDLSYLKLI